MTQLQGVYNIGVYNCLVNINSSCCMVFILLLSF